MRVNEDLLKRLKAGEEKAFEDLYWTYSLKCITSLTLYCLINLSQRFDTECLSENLGKA